MSLVLFFLLYSPQTRARAICNCRCIIIITSNHTKHWTEIANTGLRLQSHKIQLIFLFFQMENEQRKPKWISMQNFVSVLCVRVCLLYIFWRLFSERKTPLCLACIWSVFFFIDFFSVFVFSHWRKSEKKATYKCDKIDQLNWWIPSTAMSADVGPVQ